MKSVNNFVQTEKQEFKASVRSFLPQHVIVPICQSKEHFFNCFVKEGDRVTEGQVIAEGNETGLAQGLTKIHSPVPGIVEGIVPCSLPDGRMGRAVKINFGGSFSYLGKKLNREDWTGKSTDEILKIFDEKGVMNTFGEVLPLAAQIKKCSLEKGRILVVRLFDEDPSRVTDEFIAKNYMDEVAEGCAIIAKAYNAEGIAFVHPKKNNFKVEYDFLSGTKVFNTCVDTKKYPCGYAQNLIKVVRKSPKDAEEKIFNRVNLSSLFIDPETAFSVQQSVVYGIPVVEHFVHVTGNCLKSAAMFRVRAGTTIESLALQCGGFKYKAAKIIINGMISGNAVSTLSIPITKQVKSVSFVPYWELSDQSFVPCIRCGKCRSICPEGIFPDLMFRYRAGGKPIGIDLIHTANLCSGCSLCNSICPSRLPLSQMINILRKEANE